MTEFKNEPSWREGIFTQEEFLEGEGGDREMNRKEL